MAEPEGTFSFKPTQGLSFNLFSSNFLLIFVATVFLLLPLLDTEYSKQFKN